MAKKLHGESEDEENCFVKEAKLMHSIKHDNVVRFKAFSRSSCAILMEYLYFDFFPF